MAIQRRTCVIELSDKLDVINALLASGTPHLHIEQQMKAEGYAVKRETIKRHLEGCLLGRAGAGAPKPPRRRPTTSDGQIAMTKHDVAVLVQREVARKLQDGELRVTTRDGLAAQQLIDKRAEKEKDRTFVMNLARLISGAGQGAPDEIIDGEYSEVVDELMPPLLAPLELRDGS